MLLCTCDEFFFAQFNAGATHVPPVPLPPLVHRGLRRHRFRDYHQLLARKDIHAVLIASPDHWHVPMTVDAMAAGKDVYVEKPLTHNLTENKLILDALTRHPRIVQVGTQ